VDEMALEHVFSGHFVAFTFVIAVPVKSASFLLGGILIFNVCRNTLLRRAKDYRALAD